MPESIKTKTADTSSRASADHIGLAAISRPAVAPIQLKGGWTSDGDGGYEKRKKKKDKQPKTGNRKPSFSKVRKRKSKERRREQDEKAERNNSVLLNEPVADVTWLFDASLEDITNYLNKLKRKYDVELSECVDSDEAHNIINRLKVLGHSKETKLISDEDYEELDTAAHFWDPAENEGNLVEEESSDDELNKQFDFVSQWEAEDDVEEEVVDEEGEKQRKNKNKFNVAAEVTKALAPFGKLFLSGGAAATRLGGPRGVKDLDFRIELNSRSATFRFDELSGVQLVDRINEKLLKVFGRPDLINLVVQDPLTGFTIKGYVCEVEVSLTRTPDVNYLSHNIDEEGIDQLGEFDIMLDKAYSFIMRRSSDKEKRITDLIDMIAMIRPQEGRLEIFRFLSLKRQAAYDKQRNKANKRSKEERFGENMVDQFIEQLDDVLSNKTYLKECAKKFDVPDLISWISKIRTWLNKMDDTPVTEM